MVKLTLPDRLAQDPRFVQAIVACTPTKELLQLFPDYGQTTIKDARRKVKFPESGKFLVQETAPVQETVRHTSDASFYEGASSVRITTLEQLLEHCGFDGKVWDVKEWGCTKWEVGAKDKDHQVQVTALWRVTAKFVPKKLALAIIDEIESFKADAAAHAPRYSRNIRIPRATPGNLLEISIPDLHVGKFAWAKETGEPYDVHIAENLFTEALETLLARAEPYPVDRVLFVIGNDLLHVDGPGNTTFNGTPQDHDSRYFRTFQHTRRLMVKSIDRLLGVADVDVVVLPGNHDRTAAWHMGDSLGCWFRNNEQVQLDNTPNLRKYYEFGKVMLLFAHGDNEKPITKLAGIAASEQPEMWGRTRFREAHIGHLHHNELKDEPGFTIRRLPSLSAADAWHKNSGYVGVPRQAQSFIWNREEGLIGMQVFTVQPTIAPTRF